MRELRKIRPMTALVVEDDPEMRVLLQHYLRSKKFLTLSAGNGMDALDVIARTTIDILLTDVNMPMMGGIEVITALRALGFPHPILVLTSDSAPGMRSKVISAGANGCLWKPVDFNLLGNWLEQTQTVASA